MNRLLRGQNVAMPGNRRGYQPFERGRIRCASFVPELAASLARSLL